MMNIHYVLDFPQAQYDRQCCMNVPKGTEVYSDT